MRERRSASFTVPGAQRGPGQGALVTPFCALGQEMGGKRGRELQPDSAGTLLGLRIVRLGPLLGIDFWFTMGETGMPEVSRSLYYILARSLNSPVFFCFGLDLSTCPGAPWKRTQVWWTRLSQSFQLRTGVRDELKSHSGQLPGCCYL